MRLLSGLLVGLVLGCGGDDGVSPRAARSELADLGIAYTPEAFFRAAYEGDLTVVKLFVQAGMPVNARGEYGDTALMRAAGEGHLAIVKVLVGAGAYLEVRDNWGATALMRAVGEGRLAIVQELVDAGANLEVRNRSSGWTALHRAALEGRLAIVKVLVDAGADVNARDGDGDTPRDLAVYGSTFSLYSDATRARCLAVVEYFDSL